MTIASAQSRSRYHSGLVAPQSRSTADRAPYVGSKMKSQTMPTPTPDSTYGAKTTDRANVVPRNGRLSTVASARPSARVAPTVVSVKIAVTRTTSRLRGSVNQRT